MLNDHLTRKGLLSESGVVQDLQSILSHVLNDEDQKVKEYYPDTLPIDHSSSVCENKEPNAGSDAVRYRAEFVPFLSEHAPSQTAAGLHDLGTPACRDSYTSSLPITLTRSASPSPLPP